MNRIPLKDFSDYFFESIAQGAQNQLQITSICNAKCIFCSNEQNPFKIKRCSFRSYNELEKVVYATPTFTGPIHLNESLPGRISEGEAFIHPRFFDILKMIRGKFSNSIAISTNGALLTKEFIEKLKEYNPLQIAISIPTIRKEHWMESFHLTDGDHAISMAAFELLKANDIAISANLIPMPSWIGWDEIEETIKFLSDKVAHILVYAPGYTRESKIVNQMKHSKMELSLFLEEMGRKYSFTYYWSMDPRLPIHLNHDSIMNSMRFCVSHNCKNILWFTSTAALDRFTKEINGLGLGFPLNNAVLEIKNNVYGGNIECSGLWLLQDLYAALEDYLKNNPKPDQIFMPKGFLDKYGFDLQGENIQDFFKKYIEIGVGLL